MRIDTTKVWTKATLLAEIEGLEDETVLDFGKPRKADQTGECWCGCGGVTKSKFVPGHDSRFHGLAKKVARGEAVMPTEFVHDDAKADFMKWHDEEAVKVAARTAAKAKVETEKPVTKSVDEITDKDSEEYKALLNEVTG